MFLDEKSFINDRRQFKRYEMMAKLTYSTSPNKQEIESMTRDISKAGARFPVNAKFPKGTLLDIKIENFISDKPVTSKASVAWSEEFGSSGDSGNPRYEVGVKLLKKRLF